MFMLCINTKCISTSSCYSVFEVLYFNAACFCGNWLFWHIMVNHFTQELLAPYWCQALSCLACLVHILGGSCKGGLCHFACSHMLYVVIVTFFFYNYCKVLMSLTCNVQLHKISPNLKTILEIIRLTFQVRVIAKGNTCFTIPNETSPSEVYFKSLN